MNSNYPDFSMYPSSNMSAVDQWQFGQLNVLSNDCPLNVAPQITSEFSVGQPTGQVFVQPDGWPLNGAPQVKSEFSAGHPTGQVSVQPGVCPIKLEPQDNSEFSDGHPTGQVSVQPVASPTMSELLADLSEFLADNRDIVTQQVCKRVALH